MDGPHVAAYPGLRNPKGNDMTTRCVTFSAALVAALFAVRAASSADVFSMPSGQTSLGLVPVGNPGNAADPATGLGAVSYTYAIGKYDVTVAQYTTFLNAVATTADTYGLYNPYMATDVSSAGIVQGGSLGSYSYSVVGNGNMPVFDVSWWDAARFCNWLQNGQPTGPEGIGTTENGAYTLAGQQFNNTQPTVTRNPGAIYFLPSLNEWYKAAYYNASNGTYWLYPTQSNTAPTAVAPAAIGASVTTPNSANYNNTASTGLTAVGTYVNSPSPYGAFDQGGNVFQWTDTTLPDWGWGPGYACENSSWMSGPAELESGTNTFVPWTPDSAYNIVGFRVGATPEPSTVCLLAAGAGVLLAMTHWRNRRQMGR